MNFSKLIKKYENELFDSVIPFWEKNCNDREYGGYFTFLDRDGTVYDTEKFMWMQWRIVYMFAMLFCDVEKNENWLNLARQGFDFLEKNGKDRDGLYYFSLNREGVPAYAASNIFSDCFAAMGAAALYKATGENRYLAEAHHAMKNYIRRMENPKGKWNKLLSGSPSRLNLGHFMILANLSYVMKECLSVDDYDTQLRDSVEIVMEKFWNNEHRVLFENINKDYSFDLDSCTGRLVTPGHGLESVWFILQYAEMCNDNTLMDKCAEAILGLLDFGWDKTNGGIYYFMDVLGKPSPELHADMKLWWVHNEAIIAVLYAYKLSGKEIFMDWFQKLDEWSWSHFPDPEYGEWFGYLNRQGEATHTLKGGKWKTFFHLPRFLLKSINLMKEIEAGK